MGPQTNYPVKFTISNLTGVSGYDSGLSQNVLYTQGTTRPDWYDINATDGSGNPVPFWIENGTTTAHNATLWVNEPTLTPPGNTLGKLYFGNSSQSLSTQNGYGVFQFFDDFSTGTLNASQWTLTTTPTITFTNGVIRVAGTQLSYQGINTKLPAAGWNVSGINTTMRSRALIPNTGAQQENPWGYDDQPQISTQTNEAFRYQPSTNINRWVTGKNAVITDSPMGNSALYTMQVYDVKRNGSTSVIFLRNDTVENTSTVNIPLTNINGSLFTFGTSPTPYVDTDWVIIRKSLQFEPTTSNWSQNGNTPGVPLVPSFVHSPNPSVIGQTVTFTDTSTGSPTTWNWSFGDTATSTIQNPTHIYSSKGTYNVLLNVTNATGFLANVSDLQNVTNVSGFTPQDLYSPKLNLLTLQLTDLSNGNVLAGVTLTDNLGQTTTTGTNGIGVLTEQFTTVTVNCSKSGYYPKNVSYAITGDMNASVALDKPTTIAGQNVWWTPHTVQVTVMDVYGARLPNVIISATYNQSSMPIGWLTELYGIQASPAADMLNSQIVMQGVTGSDGTITFTMLGSLKYDFNLQSAALGLNVNRSLFPSDSMVNFYVTPASQHLPTDITNNTYNSMNGTRYYFFEPNASYGSMCIDYQDTSGNTYWVNETWQFQNNQSIFYFINFTPGNTLSTHCYTMKNVKGTTTWWQYAAGQNAVVNT
jgi:PKD repeat protein